MTVFLPGKMLLRQTTPSLESCAVVQVLHRQTIVMSAHPSPRCSSCFHAQTFSLRLISSTLTCAHMYAASVRPLQSMYVCSRSRAGSSHLSTSITSRYHQFEILPQFSFQFWFSFVCRQALTCWLSFQSVCVCGELQG